MGTNSNLMPRIMLCILDPLEAADTDDSIRLCRRKWGVEAAEDGQELSLSFSDSAETGESTAPHLDTADAGIANGDILEQSTQILQQLTSSQEEDTLGADRGSLKKISADPYFSAEGEEQKQVECKFLNSCEAELPAVSNTTGVNPIHSTYIFRYDDTIKYSHMAMIERLPDERFIAAWQAAPSPGNETRMRLAVEGLDAQHILMAYSKDGQGRKWTMPQRVPLHNKAALWSPVL
eukprot:gene8837-10474_t